MKGLLQTLTLIILFLLAILSCQQHRQIMKLQSAFVTQTKVNKGFIDMWETQQSFNKGVKDLLNIAFGRIVVP